MDEVLEFIQRRFKNDCHWTDGNCYYFAAILKARFPDGGIYYMIISNHFLFKYNGIYYDWTGVVNIPDYEVVLPWYDMKLYDSLVYDRIVRDCIK